MKFFRYNNKHSYIVKIVCFQNYVIDYLLTKFFEWNNTTHNFHESYISITDILRWNWDICYYKYLIKIICKNIRSRRHILKGNRIAVYHVAATTSGRNSLMVAKFFPDQFGFGINFAFLHFIMKTRASLFRHFEFTSLNNEC